MRSNALPQYTRYRRTTTDRRQPYQKLNRYSNTIG